MNVELSTPPLSFPRAFCCNCGNANCVAEVQHTRVTRFFGIGGGETTFQLSIPICPACLKSTRRPPSTWLFRLLVFMACFAVLSGVLWYASGPAWPLWVTDHLWWISAGLSLALVVLFYRMRRPTPPQTSFYQPVRIRDANVQFAAGRGEAAWLKLAFTNAEYLAVFVAANREAIQSRRLAAVMARA
jgi:hypothetical protein